MKLRAKRGVLQFLKKKKFFSTFFGGEMFTVWKLLTEKLLGE